MRIPSLGQAVFAITMTGLGVVGLLYPDFLPLWNPALSAHPFWAYFTACTFIPAALPVLTGIYARLAAALAAVQIGSFLLLVWVPILAARSKVAFHWSETILNTVLLAAAWVIAESY